MNTQFNQAQLQKIIIPRQQRKKFTSIPMNIQLLKLNIIMLMVLRKAKTLLINHAQCFKASILLAEILTMRTNL